MTNAFTIYAPDDNGRAVTLDVLGHKITFKSVNYITTEPSLLRPRLLGWVEWIEVPQPTNHAPPIRRTFWPRKGN